MDPQPQFLPPAANIEEEHVARLACDRCYRRKARCDKILPACSTCCNAGVVCCYNARSGLVRREDVDSLERRLRQMEAKNEALSQQLREARRSQKALEERSTSGHSSDTHADTGNSSHGTPHHDDNEVAEQVFSLSLNAGGQRQYLGSASGAILANLLGLGRHDDRRLSQTKDQGSRRLETALGSGLSPSDPTVDILPPEQLARGLLAAYLAHDHICYPYLHPKMLSRIVTSMYSDKTYCENHPVEAFEMDMVFAIATAQVHKLTWHIIQGAETHYERAMGKFAQVLEMGGLKALQCIMLLCQYRMLSVSYATSGSLWHLLGMATRLGLEIGLHREMVYAVPPGLSPTNQSILEEEIGIKRRCFWSLFGMDRVVSNTLGRPVAINLNEIDTEYPSNDEDVVPAHDGQFETNDLLIYPGWPANTAIFNHITWHRVITGKILSTLHNTPKSRMPSTQACEDIRRELAAELNLWRDRVEALPLQTLDTNNDSDKTTFKSPEWYRLLYHNCILMLYRPTSSLHDTIPTSEALEHLYHSSQQSIRSYGSLHRDGRINYTWITLHAVFIVGLSYVYAIRTHFQHRRIQFKCAAEGLPISAEGQLTTDPSITQIVADTRTCSTVLVALSERWNTARDCHDVFGRLSDAIMADASDFFINYVNLERNKMQNPSTTEPLGENFAPIYDLSGPQAPLVPTIDIDFNYQGCYEELQQLFGNHLGDNAFLGRPFDFNIEL